MLEPERLLSMQHPARDIWQLAKDRKQEVSLVYSSGSAGGTLDAANRQRNAQLMEDTLAGIAVQAVQEGYTRIIVAGGETSGAVTKALNLNSFQIGESIAPGVPVLISQEKPGLRLVLKSGNFGQNDFFERALSETGGQTA